jgi:PAS domain S-box-containing protein
MVWSTRPDGFHDFYNQRWYDFTGVPRDSTDGEEWSGTFHPDDQERAWSLWRDSLRTGEPYHIEYRLRHRSGEYRWVLGRAQAVRDRSGAIERWFGTCTDIDEIVRARQVLARTGQELERQVAERTKERDQLWSLSEDLLARADYAGNLLAVNPAWTRVLGWSERKLLADSYAGILHPEDLAGTSEALERMQETGQPTRFENRVQTSAGEWKPLDWTVSPEPDGKNFIAVGRDLTAAKQREVELVHAQEALRQSQKMEAMGQLTGGVAHDFNNLLTPIIGSLDMLQRREIGGAREQRLIGGALESADRAKTLVQRLLAFARRQPLRPTAIDVAALLEGMGELVASTTGPQISIAIHVSDDLIPAVADPNQLEMAILNLSVNARDAMPDGGTLTLAAQAEHVGQEHRSNLPPGDYIRLSVADTGTGMDAATRKRAVEPFFSTKGIGKGTGLGLSMVHGLASQLGGAMHIASEPGFGTKIELWLPVSAEPAGPVASAQAECPVAQGAGTVLLVDDEETVRTSTADMLADLGYQVFEAATAAEALALLESGLRVDLLLTDHLMPGMTGTDLAREARDRWPGCPVLLISGFAEADGVAPDLPRLTKPFRQAELAAALQDLG